MARLEGGCLCGAVRLAVEGNPYRVGICHCLDCRKSQGAIFRAFAIYPRDALRVTGETRQYRQKGKTDRHFCARCFSPLFQLTEGGDEAELFIGALDATSQLRPSYELWMGRREEWLPAMDVPLHYPFNREGRGRTEP
jgi:hypothetical protein